MRSKSGLQPPRLFLFEKLRCKIILYHRHDFRSCRSQFIFPLSWKFDLSDIKPAISRALCSTGLFEFQDLGLFVFWGQSLFSVVPPFF